MCAGPPSNNTTFDAAKYDGLLQALRREKQWPSEAQIAVVGPAGDEFARAAADCLAAAQGCEPISTSVTPKARLQSIRMLFTCQSPDAFCTLHSALSEVTGTKAVV